MLADIYVDTNPHMYICISLSLSLFLCVYVLSSPFLVFPPFLSEGMLRPCVWLLGCTTFLHAGGVCGGKKLSCLEPVDATPLGKELLPFIPLTFTALSQISRSVSAELREKVSEAGGLRSVLISHPKLFKVTKVGDVYVARCLRKWDGNAVLHEQKRKGCEKDVHSLPRVPPSVVFDVFPTFYVPVEALVEKMSRIATANADESNADKMRRYIEMYRDFIDVVTLKDTGSKPMLWEFVRLRPSLAEFVRRREEAAKEDAVTISRLMEPYEVLEYEPYRAARLIPVVETFVPISSEMRRDALQLLAEGRCLLHVFVSAPHIFEVTDTPVLSVRFLLDPHYRPNITHTQEEILRQLDEIKEARVKKGLRVPIDRKKRRALLRQLQFGINPTPYFDERVMAHALMDTLPLDGPVSFSRLMSVLPSDCARCLPQHPRRIIFDNPHLFRKIEGEQDLLVQRADLPAPQERDVSSIGSEEIVLLLYNKYPRRRHPSCGTCLERCLYSMPWQVRRRLSQLDFVEDVLRKHPDRVEVLNQVDEELLKFNTSVQFPCRYQMFRFVGDLQEELVRRYETLCIKLGHDPEKTKRLL